MSDRVRIGVIGTGPFTDLMHLPNLKSHPRADLAAICGRNQERAGLLAARYAIPQVYHDYRRLIDRGQLDAVVVATPDDLHYPMVMHALEAGLHVLCEKPLTLTVAQAQEMLERAEARGVKHMTYFTFRWLPPYRYLHHLIGQGYLGRCYHAEFRFLAGFGRVLAYSWRFDARRSLGALGDLGAHLVDLARWLIGEIQPVAATLDRYVTRPRPENGRRTRFKPANEAAHLLVRFTNGAQGSLLASTVAHTADRGQEQQLVFHGQGGALEARLTGLWAELQGARATETAYRPLAVPDEFWAGVDRSRPPEEQVRQVFTRQPVADRQFVDAILHDRPITPSFYDGLKAQEVLAAALAAAAPFPATRGPARSAPRTRPPSRTNKNKPLNR
jgi:predicted dehydrogenase